MPADRTAFPPVLTAEAMGAADRYTMETFGLPGFTLMESAGRAAAERLRAAYGPMDAQRVAILCGKGHNGGDGLVVARQLLAYGAAVHVTLMTTDDLTGDPARNLDLLRHLQREAPAADRLTLSVLADAQGDAVTAVADALRTFRPTLYVDALLGTGLTSALRAPLDRLVPWLNAQPEPTASLDVPTGLHSDTGQILGAAVEAERTVTMAAPKAGLLLGAGPRVAGTVETVEIGIPAFVLDRMVEAPGCARQMTTGGVRGLLPRRAHDTHKYAVGMALVVAGGPGFTGAPAMSAMGAARAGAGYVTCACAASVQPTVAVKLTDVPTVALPEDADGLAPDAALDALAPTRAKAKALLVGPGLGRADGTQRFVRRLLETTDLPAVLDADALNALAGIMDAFAEAHADGRWVLTPHAGEFKRLAGDDVDLADRVRVATRHAQRWHSVLVLKGMPSIVATPEGRAFIGSAGTPALATAGTGDVLAGLCAGLLAQGLAPADAACCALHLGGLAAQRYAAEHGPHGMIATDLLDHVPRAFADVLASGDVPDAG